MSSEYSGTSNCIDFGTIYNNKPALALLGSHDRFILFDSILNLQEAKELHRYLGGLLKKFEDANG